MAKKNKIHFLLIFSFLIQANYISAQFYSEGTEPFSSKWEQLNTKNFKIIYPKGLYNDANRFLNYLEWSDSASNLSLNYTPKKIKILLHNQNMLSNGFVTWAPRRMEILSTPPQNSSSLYWYQLLALHEYRHVTQTGKLNKGFTRFFTTVLGESGLGLTALQSPLWLIEGDAVVMETALSSAGRGSQPEFEMPLRAMVTANKHFNYNKMVLGSYKHHVPDRYEFGYQISTYSRLKYGKNVWEPVFKNIGNQGIIPGSFYRSLKNYNTSPVKLYKSTFDTLKYLWNNQIDNTKVSDYSNISIPLKKEYTNYRYISPIDKNLFAAVQSKLKSRNVIISVDINGIERKLYEPGFRTEERISVKDNKIAWAEVVTDIRYAQKNYSVIKIYDIKTHKVKQLTKKSKYFSPCISEDGKRICVVELDNPLNCNLVILSSETGEVHDRIEFTTAATLQYPVWGNDSSIYLFAVNEKGKSIVQYNLKSRNWSIILSPSYSNIYQLEDWNDYLLYRADYSGIENIYAIDKISKKIYRVTSSKYGAFDPVIDKSENILYYSDYTVDGYNPVYSKLNTNRWNPIEKIESNAVNWNLELCDQESFNLNKTTNKKMNYSSKKYRRFTNLFNLHSWTPFYYDIENLSFDYDEAELGFMLLSQNLLSTFTSIIGFNYKNNKFQFHPQFIYEGFYPVFSFSAKYGGENNYLLSSEEVASISFPKNLEYKIKMHVPFRIVNNSFGKYLQPEISYEYNTVYYSDSIKGIIKNHNHYLNLGFYISRLKLLSFGDINPKWGQYFNIDYTFTPDKNYIYGNLFALKSGFYFPGFFYKHSFLLRFGYTKQFPEKYYISKNYLNLPRGYNQIVYSYLSDELMVFRTNYSFPIVYPDLGFGSIFYLKRIRANAFSDYAYGNVIEQDFNGNISRNKFKHYYSEGIELNIDYHLLRIPFLLSSGIRISYLPKTGKIYPELLISGSAPFL